MQEIRQGAIWVSAILLATFAILIAWNLWAIPELRAIVESCEEVLETCGR